MKLLQILYSGLGGHSSVAFSLIEGDEKKEFQHFLLGFGIEKPSNSYKSKCLEYGITPFSVTKKIGLDIKSLFKTYQKLKEIQPNYIIMHSTSLILVVWYYALFHKVKFISVEHQPNPIKTKKDWFYTFLITLFSPKVGYLTDIYITEIKDKSRFFLNKKKVSVINNGINTLKFKPAESHIKKNEYIVISMIARMMNTKDHFTLIAAFKEISKEFAVKLFLAGDGNLKGELEKYSEQLKLQDKVIFTGTIDENEVIELIHNTDIYVHSSLGETLSTSLLQVMACKTPIIATNIPGINNLLINNKDALLFNPKDKNTLVAHIKKLINDETLREKLCKNSYEKVLQNYSCTKMFENYKTILIK